MPRWTSQMIMKPEGYEAEVQRVHPWSLMPTRSSCREPGLSSFVMGATWSIACRTLPLPSVTPLGNLARLSCRKEVGRASRPPQRNRPSSIDWSSQLKEWRGWLLNRMCTSSRNLIQCQNITQDNDIACNSYFHHVTNSGKTIRSRLYSISFFHIFQILPHSNSKQGLNFC